MIKFCKYCNKKIKNLGGLFIHERNCKLNPNRNPTIPKNKGCKGLLKFECICCKKCGKKVAITQYKNHLKSCNGILKEKLMACPFCKINLIGIKPCNIANHIRWCELNPKRIKNKEKEKKYQKKFCSLCGKEIEGRRTRCKECGHKHTEQTKIVMSNKRICWLKQNPEKHPWRKKDKFVSVPCQKFKEYLDSINLKYIPEYDTYNETNRNFSIDIAFPNIKLGIEINGNQHYNKNGTLKKYYQERHTIIEANGWKLLEVHYSICFKKEKIEKIIESYIKG